MSDCLVCGGVEWVCENHATRPWDGMSDREDACGCGAGMPCYECNSEMACSGYAHKARRDGYMAGIEDAANAAERVAEFNAKVREERIDEELAVEFRCIGKRIAAAIRALKEALP